MAGYTPSIWSRVVAGIQWTYVAFIMATNTFSLYVDYLLLTRSEDLSVNWGFELYVLIGVSFALGFIWAERRTASQPQEENERQRRIEHIFLMFVIPLVLLWIYSSIPFDLPASVSLVAVEAIYALGIGLAFALVYHFEIDTFTRFSRRWMDGQQQ